MLLLGRAPPLALQWLLLFYHHIRGMNLLIVSEKIIMSKVFSTSLLVVTKSFSVAELLNCSWFGLGSQGHLGRGRSAFSSQ